MNIFFMRPLGSLMEVQMPLIFQEPRSSTCVANKLFELKNKKWSGSIYLHCSVGGNSMGQTPRKSCTNSLWIVPHVHSLGFIHGVQCKVAVNSLCNAASPLVSAQASDLNPHAHKPP